MFSTWSHDTLEVTDWDSPTRFFVPFLDFFSLYPSALFIFSLLLHFQKNEILISYFLSKNKTKIRDPICEDTTH